ncbi:MAG: hypothetical protein HDT21_06000 [Ruminococcus sp.]|nr:hypothetical protein [Ruminococcus sp.]
MEYTYSFGYPNMQRVLAITEALNNSQTVEKYQIDYRGKYRPLSVIEVPIEMLVYRIENIRTKSLQKQWLAQHRDLPRDLFVSDPFSIEAQETQHQVLKLLIDKENLLKTFKNNDKLQQTEPLICSNDGIVVNGNRRLCAWRELYYNNKIKYAHFQTVRVAVLPDSDPQGMYDLEIALQIRSDMKAEYVWHTIAADYQEKFDLGMDIGILAEKQNKKPEEISTYIECYNYAAQYLESIGHPDEWMLVDKQEYAFKQIVIGRKNISNPGDKELFQEISKAMLQAPADGDRLYKQIPKVVSGLATIAPKLQEVFSITIQDNNDDDLELLTGGDNGIENTTNSQIAAGIRIADNPTLVAKTVQSVLNTTEELEKEKKKKSFIFDQVMKAATLLTNAVSNLDDSMSKDGVGKQLENIEGACVALKDWIK